MNKTLTASWNVPVCTFADDNTFGPAVVNQCRAFDFTLLFEQIFLSLIPSLLLISSGCLRVVGIFHRGARTLPSRLHGSKLVNTSISKRHADVQLTIIDICGLLRVFTVGFAGSISIAVCSAYSAFTACFSLLIYMLHCNMPIISFRAYQKYSTFSITERLSVLHGPFRCPPAAYALEDHWT